MRRETASFVSLPVQRTSSRQSSGKRTDDRGSNPMMSAAVLLAAVAGAITAVALIALVQSTAGALLAYAAPLAHGAAARAERILRPLRRARVEGALPTDAERLQLCGAGAITGLALGAVLAGPVVGLGLAAGCSWLASRSLVWHRRRYRRRLDQGTAAAALALADGLAAGHSVRGALTTCGNGLGGPIGKELRSVGHELELGAETETSLERLRTRARSRRVDLIVAAVRIQRRSGGSLATLLRGIATTLEDQDRLDAEVRAATAQARFTSIVVLLLPLAGLLLAELAAPGSTGGMTASTAGAWLLGAAAVLQLSGLLLIRRLTRDS
jgi:tight adherence protein B